MSMTAEQIDVLVRDWPEAARKGYQHYTASAEDATYADKLYWEMVGRGLGWLAENNDRNCKDVAVGSKKEAGRHLIVIGGDVQWFVYSQPYNGSGDYMECAGRECELGPFPHPLAAVSAAVLAAAKEGA